jgi:hypothetical protein
MSLDRANADVPTAEDIGRRCLRRRCALAGALVPLLVALLWAALGPSVGSIEAYASDVHDRGERPQTEALRARQGLPPHEGDELLERVTYELEHRIESGLGEKRSGNVEAASLLRTYARVYDERGDPMKGARVEFVWRSGDDEDRVSRTTDSRGSAMSARWIAEKERGVPTVLVVLVETPRWSDSDYTWFVPE